jgi:hypothetical protein
MAKKSVFQMHQSAKASLLLKTTPLFYGDRAGCVIRFRGRRYLHADILLDGNNNLFKPIRKEVVSYFNKNKIPFWKVGGEVGAKKPTGHVLSSQIACINHLFFMRQRQDIVTMVLKNIDSAVKIALPLDNDTELGFVSFEVVGRKNYLNEKHHTRGANATSIDAAMLAEMQDGTRKLFIIEWKYTEHYNGQARFQDDNVLRRKETYLPSLQKEDCPIRMPKPIKDTLIEGFFYEPFYQLMRQTLLAHEMVKAQDFGATEYQHIYVIPTANMELIKNTPDKMVVGSTLENVWAPLLKSKEKYKVIDPQEFLAPANEFSDVNSNIEYLEQRYWQPSREFFDEKMKKIIKKCMTSRSGLVDVLVMQPFLSYEEIIRQWEKLQREPPLSPMCRKSTYF